MKKSNKKLSVKRPRGGLSVRTNVTAGKKGAAVP